jgi:16S rRNA (uracil1498-N3)-methyltransferase
MPDRFFVPELPHPRLSDGLCVLSEEETRHARKVLRLSPGDEVELFDGRGSVGTAFLADYMDEGAVCKVTAVTQVEPLRPAITVAAAVPKGDLAEHMVDQLSQLGADRFVPMATARSVVDPRDTKLDRFRRIAIESAKQCGRLTLMQIDAVTPYEKVLAEVCDFGVILDPRGGRPPSLRDDLRDRAMAIAIVGPEGGFTDDELHLADHAGFTRWCISPNTLRIGTAAATATAILRYLA